MFKFERVLDCISVELSIFRTVGSDTETRIASCTSSGFKNTLVICATFVIDCLEILEEIAIQGQIIFAKLGGKSLIFISCPNYHLGWVSTLALWCLNV